MSRSIKLSIGILVSVVCVWLSMRDVRLSEVVAALRQANYGGFALSMALTLVGFWIRAIRWRSLISSPRRLSTDSLFSATMIGFMANNVLPFRLGEFVRPWALARRENLSKTTLLATVVVERAVDMLTLLGILGVAMLVHPLDTSTEGGRMTRAGAGVLVVMCLGLTAFVIALEWSPKLAHTVFGWLTRPLPEKIRTRIMSMLEHFFAGLGLFKDLPRLAWVFLLSFAMFLTFAFGLSVCMASLRLDVPWYGGLTMLVITAIGIMVPAAPGYIGTLNLACIAGLALFHVGKDAAVPFSWFYWASQWIPVTFVGLFYLQREGLSLKSLGEAEKAEPASA